MLTDVHKENEDRIIIDDIGYGFCTIDHKCKDPFVTSASTNTLIETYFGHEIRMYTGGRCIFKSDWLSFGLYTFVSYSYRNNHDILITKSETHGEKLCEENFARIRPKITNPGLLVDLFPRLAKRDYSDGWMASEYTIGKIKEAIEHFKKSIDDEIARAEKEKNEKQGKINAYKMAVETLMNNISKHDEICTEA